MPRVTIGGTSWVLKLREPVESHELGGVHAVVVAVADAEVTEPVELGADADPGHQQVVVEGGLVLAEGPARRVALPSS